MVLLDSGGTFWSLL